jgi:hypothetical protein
MMRRHPRILVVDDDPRGRADLRATSPDVPIIVLSAGVTWERETLARRLGARHVLPKPPEMGEVLQLCRELTVMGNDLMGPLTASRS